MNTDKIDDRKTWLQVAHEIIPEITEDEVTSILWNETCYPFDNETTLSQFKKVLSKLKFNYKK